MEIDATACPSTAAESDGCCGVTSDKKGSDWIPDSEMVCKHWQRRGLCFYGDRCRYKHLEPGSDVPSERPRIWGGRRPKLRNKGRAQVFRRWLCDKFGMEFLRSGSGICDVAGGQDPREPNSTRWSRLVKMGMWHKDTFGSYVTRSMADVEAEGAVHPSRLPVLWTEESWRRLFGCIEAPVLELPEDGDSIGPADIGDQEWFEEALAEAAALSWTTKGLVENESEGTTPTLEDENIFSSFDEAATAVKNCSILVGLHCDQAAGAIVDSALQMKKPFAVVPCCVYSRQFPKRKLPSGQPVRSYENLCDWLQAKDCSIQVETLDFEGKNRVLYWLPPVMEVVLPHIFRATGPWAFPNIHKEEEGSVRLAWEDM